jgi:resolvase-like protein
VNGQQKITAAHLGRKAIVYLRQSSMAQVRDNTESTARQYALADLAADLGWPHRDVTAIDADLGTSGRSVEHRQGLRDLVAQICLGEVGAIFVLEVSRLARSSTDFGRVMDLARIADTLLIDADGVYDLRDINDRLVLGLKSTMSEALCRYRHKASDIVPLRPSSRRSLKSQGSYSPSSSRINVPAITQISSNLCQSVLLRARRETSRPSTIPARPMPTSATRRLLSRASSLA